MKLKSNVLLAVLRGKIVWAVLILVLVLCLGAYIIYRYEPFASRIEISNELGGNIFPVTILSTATTDANIVVPADSTYLGNPKSCIAIKVRNRTANSKLQIEVEETPFLPALFPNSFFLNQERIIWFFLILSGITRPCWIISSPCRLRYR